MKMPNFVRVYGDLTFRGACKKEDVSLITFFDELRRDYPEIAARAFHVENEGKRSWQQAQTAQAKGMLKGVSDITIIGVPPLVLELKQKDSSKAKWEAGQQAYLEACHKSGAFVCVCFGFEAAWEALHDWIKTQKNIQNNLL